jgi:hypothetical protein
VRAGNFRCRHPQAREKFGRRTRTWVAAPPPLPQTRAGGPMQTRAEFQWAGSSSVTSCRAAPHVSVQSFGYGYDPVSFREEVKGMSLFAVTLANVVIQLQTCDSVSLASYSQSPPKHQSRNLCCFVTKLLS